MKLIILIFILCFSFNLYGKTGSVTGLDIPRFVSLKSDDANIRVGPSVNYPIKLKYVFQNLPLEIIDINSNQFIKKFKELIKLRCEPLSVPNEVVLSLIANKAKKDGVKVLISGEGADEFFAGYDRIYRWAKNTRQFSIKKFCELYC